jgi:hypothetical protein
MTRCRDDVWSSDGWWWWCVVVDSRDRLGRDPELLRRLCRLTEGSDSCFQGVLFLVLLFVLVLLLLLLPDLLVWLLRFHGESPWMPTLLSQSTGKLDVALHDDDDHTQYPKNKAWERISFMLSFRVLCRPTRRYSESIAKMRRLHNCNGSHMHPHWVIVVLNYRALNGRSAIY